MERLTKRTTEGIVVKEDYGEEVLKTLYQCFGAEVMPHYANCEEGYCAMERLATYEDTDLTPEQINEMDKLYREKCEEVNKLNAELVELKVQLPPCEVGDTVYHVVNNMICEVENVDLFFLLLSVAEKRFGKTVFLSKSEAEQELERRKHE